MRILSLPSFQGEEAASRPATGHTGKEGTLRRHGALTRPEPPSWGSGLWPGLGEELRKVPGTSLQVDSSKKLVAQQAVVLLPATSGDQRQLPSDILPEMWRPVPRGRAGGAPGIPCSVCLPFLGRECFLWTCSSLVLGLLGLWPLVPLPRWKPFPSREFSGKEP